VPAFVLAQAWQAWRLLRSRRIDVIHAHWLLPQGLIAALLSKCSRRVPSFLVTSHGADLFALRGKVANMFQRFVIRKAAAVTVVSEAMREELERIGTDVGKVDVRPMGVDMSERFTPEPGTGRSDDEILFVGRLVEKKGLRHLIDAMPTILSSRPTAFLTVVGFGPDEPARSAQVRHLGLQDKVHFAGALPQSKLPAMYRRAAVFVAPFVEAASGDREGLGLVAVEAAACGCPVIVSDLPAVRDVFPAGTGARMVPAGSPASLSEAIVAILSDGARARSDAARLIPALKARFDWHVVAKGYTSIFDSLMEQNPRRI
jgi:glycosyltransferase involved in cell wall biosynthesis